MIEIQLTHEGKWIPLIRAMTSMDMGIAEAQRILNAGLMGIRIRYPQGGIAWEARRVSPRSKQFLWRSGAMAGPAFADL